MTENARLRMSTCDNCRYWDTATQHGNAQPDTTGLCRKRAPQVNKITGMAIWPFTEYTDWCGEFTEVGKEIQL